MLRQREVFCIKNQKFVAILVFSFLPSMAFCLIFFDRGSVLHLLSDACAIAGLMCMILGLWRVTRKLGLYDGVIYSFKKLHEVARTKNYNPRESEIGQRHEYILSHPYTQRWHEPLAACGLYFALSLVLALVV